MENTEQQENNSQNKPQSMVGNFLRLIKNVSKNTYSRAKNIPASFRGGNSNVGNEMSSTPLVGVMNKKNLIMIAVVLIIIIGLCFSLVSLSRNGGTDSGSGDVRAEREKEKEKVNKELIATIKGGELAGRYKVEDRVQFGDLEVTIHNKREGSYDTLETNFNGERVQKGYYSALIQVFNMSNNTNDILLFALTDDKGNDYLRDQSIEFFLDSTKDFGPAKEIYPRTIREGELLFDSPVDEAKSLELTIYSTVRDEKIIYEFER